MCINHITIIKGISSSTLTTASPTSIPSTKESDLSATELNSQKSISHRGRDSVSIFRTTPRHHYQWTRYGKLDDTLLHTLSESIFPHNPHLHRPPLLIPIIPYIMLPFNISCHRLVMLQVEHKETIMIQPPIESGMIPQIIVTLQFNYLVKYHHYILMDFRSHIMV